jgi:hypothetical protein
LIPSSIQVTHAAASASVATSPTRKGLTTETFLYRTLTRSLLLSKARACARHNPPSTATVICSMLWAGAALTPSGRRLWRQRRFRRAVFMLGLVANLAFIVFALAYTATIDGPF